MSLEELVKECCMIALMCEIETISKHMMKADYERGCMGGSVPGYIRRAATYMWSGGLPPPTACECLPTDESECRWHMPHVEYLHGLAAHLLSMELYLMESSAEIHTTPAQLLSTCELILRDNQDPYNIRLKEWLEESTIASIMQFREY